MFVCAYFLWASLHQFMRTRNVHFDVEMMLYIFTMKGDVWIDTERRFWITCCKQTEAVLAHLLFFCFAWRHNVSEYVWSYHLLLSCQTHIWKAMINSVCACARTCVCVCVCVWSNFYGIFLYGIYAIDNKLHMMVILTYLFILLSVIRPDFTGTLAFSKNIFCSKDIYRDQQK